MRRILATVLLALSAAVGLPGAAEAGGPTSVLITQPGVSAGALYYDDEAYDALVELLPSVETQGKPQPPGGGGADYNLTWMVHDVMPWRYDRVHVARDGTAWVATAFTADGTAGWEQLRGGAELVGILRGVVGDPGAPGVVSVAPDVSPASPPTGSGPSESEASAPWVSLTGWRWLVPGVVLGLLVGTVAARRRLDDEPRQVLLTSDS